VVTLNGLRHYEGSYDGFRYRVDDDVMRIVPEPARKYGRMTQNCIYPNINSAHCDSRNSFTPPPLLNHLPKHIQSLPDSVANHVRS